MKNKNILSKAEMKNVMGGLLNVASCTASCPGKEDVVCEGSVCGKTDGLACYGVVDGVMDIKTCENSPIKDLS